MSVERCCHVMSCAQKPYIVVAIQYVQGYMHILPYHLCLPFWAQPLIDGGIPLQITNLTSGLLMARPIALVVTMT